MPSTYPPPKHREPAGGTVLVQDPAQAEFRSMPDAAIATGAVDEKLPLDGIAKRLVHLVEVERP